MGADGEEPLHRNAFVFFTTHGVSVFAEVTCSAAVLSFLLYRADGIAAAGNGKFSSFPFSAGFFPGTSS